MQTFFNKVCRPIPLKLTQSINGNMSQLKIFLNFAKKINFVPKAVYLDRKVQFNLDVFG